MQDRSFMLGLYTAKPHEGPLPLSPAGHGGTEGRHQPHRCWPAELAARGISRQPFFCFPGQPGASPVNIIIRGGTKLNVYGTGIGGSGGDAVGSSEPTSPW